MKTSINKHKINQIKSHAETVMAVAAASTALYNGSKKLIQRLRPKDDSWTILIPEDEKMVYSATMLWISTLPSDEVRQFSIELDWNDGEPTVVTFPHGEEAAWETEVDGHKISVWIGNDARDEDKEATQPSDVTKSLVNAFVTSADLHIRAENREGYEAVVSKLTEEVMKKHERSKGVEVSTRLMTRHGWRWMEPTPTRPPESLVLKGNTLEYIIQDMELFIASEQRYIELGIPWHRGYLFHGPPGTGKTSIARTLASHFKFNLYFISLSDLAADTQLIAHLADISSRGMLVLEDIDISSAATERDDAREGVTLSALLNALDGIVTPHGLITVMTTNDIDSLDPALLRAGRSDVKLKIDYISDQDHLNRLVRHVLGREPREEITYRGVPICPADIVEVAKANINNSGAMERSLNELVIKGGWR